MVNEISAADDLADAAADGATAADEATEAADEADWWTDAADEADWWPSSWWSSSWWSWWSEAADEATYDMGAASSSSTPWVGSWRNHDLEYAQASGMTPSAVRRARKLQTPEGKSALCKYNNEKKRKKQNKDSERS